VLTPRRVAKVELFPSNEEGTKRKAIDESAGTDKQKSKKLKALNPPKHQTNRLQNEFNHNGMHKKRNEIAMSDWSSEEKNARLTQLQKDHDLYGPHSNSNQTPSLGFDWKILTCMRCGIVTNRDTNACFNMIQIYVDHVAGRQRNINFTPCSGIFYQPSVI